MTRICIYEKNHRNAFELFRKSTFDDGNQSLTHTKIDPDNFNGRIWCSWEDDNIVSILALEDDHYTDTPDVGRICRYHIIKKYRHGRYGFKMLDYLVDYARTCKKLIYWTHDINNKPLNALYQHKKRFYDNGDNSYYDREPFTLLTLDRRWLFKDNPNSDMLQYVYFIKFVEFDWQPKKCVVWQEHNGEL
jgi:hypothetical protein